MQVHAALGFIGQRSKSLGLLPVEVQFGCVLKAKHDRMLRHACFAAFNVRLQDRFPVQPRRSALA